MSEISDPKCSKKLKEEDLEKAAGGRICYYHHDIDDAIPNFTGVCCNKSLTSNGHDYDCFQGNSIGFDRYRCDVCGKEYRRYWEGNFWTIHDYYFVN